MTKIPLPAAAVILAQASHDSSPAGYCVNGFRQQTLIHTTSSPKGTRTWPAPDVETSTS